jgi:hypothetical protein
MKYIRTKDGRIIDTTKYPEHPASWGVQASDYALTIKQSENLEELCDEFVGIDNTCENGHQLLRAVPYKCANFWNGGVYGAVWCEWGLKYVAKLDDKGELELI